MKPVVLIVTFALGLGVGVLGARARLSHSPTDPGDAPGIVAAAPVGSVATGTPAIEPCTNEAQLRRVVREELAAAAAASVPSPGSPAPASAVVSPAPASSADQIELINRRVDEYIRAGDISAAEMAALQGEIARLDPVAQRAAIGKLVRAMNSGALAGNL